MTAPEQPPLTDQARFVYLHTARPGRGCGQVNVLDETTASALHRDPKAFERIWCSLCRKHHPVGEFTWMTDGTRVGT